MTKTTGRIRFRAIALGLFLGLIVCAVTPFNNAYLGATPLAGGHFPLAPFFILIWLTVILAVLSRILKRKPLLSGMELLISWVLMVVVSGIGFTGLARTFFINITAPYYFASSGNRWETVLQPLLPKAWYPQDPAAIEQVFNGLEGGRQMDFTQVLANIPWDAWLTPLVTWGVFILLCYFIMICMVNIFGRQWVVNERVNFPLLRVPQLMAEAYDEQRLGGFFLNRFMLAGLFLAMSLHILNGLSFYYPSVPQVPTLILASSYFPKYGFFSGFHKLKIYIYPAFIGFAFLTTRQISFSFWFFFLLGGLMFGALSSFGLNVPDAALGVVFGPTMARPEEAQMIGAYLVFFLFLIWLSRFHLMEVIKEAVIPGRGVKNGSRPGEWIPARYALWGLCIGFFLLTAWGVWFGMPILPALLLLGGFFIFMLVASRIICQGGMPYFTLTAAPTDALIPFVGSRFFTSIGLIMAAVMQKVLFVDLRESLMPSLFHAGKVSEKASRKKLILAGIGAALVLAVVISFVSVLFLGHKYGLREMDLEWATSTTLNVYDNVQRLIEAPGEARGWVAAFAGIGAVVMIFLVVAYQRFYWWPIHPLGYLVAYSSAMRILWFSFFVGWLCNHLTLHYGGAALFKRVRYFFIGLIIGDFLMGGFWAIVGLFAGVSYNVLPT